MLFPDLSRVKVAIADGKGKADLNANPVCWVSEQCDQGSRPMHDMPNEAIRSTLARRAGDKPDSSAIAEAALDTWRCVSDRLEPVIGRRGVNALFNRALHVTCKTYPSLAFEGMDGNEAVQLAGLRLHLSDCEPAAAEEASYVLLLTFSVLLANLIGESLTKRLLGPVWSPPSPNSEEMSTS